MSLRREWLKNNNKIIGNGVIYTKSTHFVMPMIGYELGDYISFNNTNHLINCHLDLKNNRIVIIIDNIKNTIIKNILLDNKFNPYYLGSELDDNEKEIVLFYSIPDKWKNDLDIFLTSRYSKMSNEYKNKLVEIYGRQSNTKSYRANQFDVLYPTSYKKQQWADHYNVDINIIQELSSKLDMDYENYKNIEELSNSTVVNKKKEEEKNEIR